MTYFSVTPRRTTVQVLLTPFRIFVVSRRNKGVINNCRYEISSEAVEVKERFRCTAFSYLHHTETQFRLSPPAISENSARALRCSERSI